jgi:UrcA family protein
VRGGSSYSRRRPLISLFKEIEMNKTIAATARALTICVAATLGFSAANASTDGVSNDRTMKNAVRTYTVRFADLDVSNFEGAKTLYARLRYAAKVVCAPLESARAYATNQYESCVNKAIADAVAGVNRPVLSRYHQSRTKNDKTHIVELAKAN